jgi:predicted phage replisome organizer
MGRKYWLKLNEHFFESDEILYLESLQDGDRYITIWLKILLKCLRSEDDTECGLLRFRRDIPYTADLLSKAIHCNKDTLVVALELFKKLGMLQVVEDGVFYVEEVQKLIGRESDSAERVRRFREKRLLLDTKPLQCNADTVTDTVTEVTLKHNKEIELEIDIDKEKEKNSTAPTVTIDFSFDDSTWLGITLEDKRRWAETFPACDIDTELCKMREWLLGHPEKRKKRYRPFITGWLSRTQDAGGTKGRKPPARKEEPTHCTKCGNPMMGSNPTGICPRCLDMALKAQA